MKTWVGSAHGEINRYMLDLDTALTSEARELAEQFARPGRLTVAAARVQLEQERAHYTMFGDIALLDSRGAVFAASDADMARSGLLLPPGFVEAALAPGAPRLNLSLPTSSARGSEPVLYAARVVELADARMLLVTELPLASVVERLSTDSDEPGVYVRLERADGRLMASSPREDLRLRRPLASVLAPALADGEAQDAPDRASGAPAIVAARVLMQPGLLVTGSIPLATAQAHAEVDTGLFNGVGFGLGFITLLIVLGADTLARRSARASHTPATTSCSARPTINRAALRSRVSAMRARSATASKAASGGSPAYIGISQLAAVHRHRALLREEAAP